MTSPLRDATGSRRLSREQAVAALLVGAVVILLGFASGLGISPAVSPGATGAAAVAPAAPPASVPPPAPSTPAAVRPADPTTVVNPPVAYVGEPAPPATIVTAANPAPVPASTGASAAPGPSSAPAPPTTSSTTPPPPSVTAPPPACSPDVLSTLLGLLLPAPDSGGLLGLASVLQSISDIAGANALLQAGPGTLLDQVTGLLASPALTSTAPVSAPATAACTGEVQQALSLVAAGQDVPSAVRTATRTVGR